MVPGPDDTLIVWVRLVKAPRRSIVRNHTNEYEHQLHEWLLPVFIFAVVVSDNTQGLNLIPSLAVKRYMFLLP